MNFRTRTWNYYGRFEQLQISMRGSKLGRRQTSKKRVVKNWNDSARSASSTKTNFNRSLLDRRASSRNETCLGECLLIVASCLLARKLGPCSRNLLMREPLPHHLQAAWFRVSNNHHIPRNLPTMPNWLKKCRAILTHTGRKP